MKLWVLSKTANVGYDTYDGAVVAAETEDEAKLIHPYGYVWGKHEDYRGGRFMVWVTDHSYTNGRDWTEPKNVSAVYIGEAAPGTKRGVILGSFNAG